MSTAGLRLLDDEGDLQPRALAVWSVSAFVVVGALVGIVTLVEARFHGRLAPSAVDHTVIGAIGAGGVALIAVGVFASWRVRRFDLWDVPTGDERQRMRWVLRAVRTGEMASIDPADRAEARDYLRFRINVELARPLWGVGLAIAWASVGAGHLLQRGDVGNWATAVAWFAVLVLWIVVLVRFPRRRTRQLALLRALQSSIGPTRR